MSASPTDPRGKLRKEKLRPSEEIAHDHMYPPARSPEEEGAWRAEQYELEKEQESRTPEEAYEESRLARMSRVSDRRVTSLDDSGLMTPEEQVIHDLELTREYIDNATDRSGYGESVQALEEELTDVQFATQTKQMQEDYEKQQGIHDIGLPLPSEAEIALRPTPLMATRRGRDSEIEKRENEVEFQNSDVDWSLGVDDPDRPPSAGDTNRS